MKRLLIDKHLAENSKKFLLDLGFDLIETCKQPCLEDSTATHPDMQFFLIKNNVAIVSDRVLCHYENVLPDFTLLPFKGICSGYPEDCLLNIAKVGDKHFMTKFQFEKLNCTVDFSFPIFTKQGYSKCSICILNDEAILTGDAGIHRIAVNNGMRSYLLDDSEIMLDGYKKGFWGGCSGLIGNNKLFFNGDIEKNSNYQKLTDILAKEKIEPIYHKEIPLCDNGSIILLDI